MNGQESRIKLNAFDYSDCVAQTVPNSILSVFKCWEHDTDWLPIIIADRHSLTVTDHWKPG